MSGNEFHCPYPTSHPRREGRGPLGEVALRNQFKPVFLKTLDRCKKYFSVGRWMLHHAERRWWGQLETNVCSCGVDTHLGCHGPFHRQCGALSWSSFIIPFGEVGGQEKRNKMAPFSGRQAFCFYKWTG